MHFTAVDLRQEGGFAGHARRWHLRADTLPDTQATRLRTLLTAAWAAMSSSAPAAHAVEPDDVNGQRQAARDAQEWTLTCLRGDEELTCRVRDGEPLPDAVAALMRFVRETGSR